MRVRLRSVDVHEWDVELPDLTDRANRQLVPSHLTEELKAGLLARRVQIVDAKTKGLDGCPSEPRRQHSQGEQRASEEGVAEVHVANVVPDGGRRRREIDGVDLDLPRDRYELVEHRVE
jgi:hypothetical protein